MAFTSPLDLCRDLTVPITHRILVRSTPVCWTATATAIHHSAQERAAWRVVVKHAPTKTEAQARLIIGAWVKSGVLVAEDYQSPTTFKKAQGLRVDNSKRPTSGNCHCRPVGRGFPNCGWRPAGLCAPAASWITVQSIKIF